MVGQSLFVPSVGIFFLYIFGTLFRRRAVRKSEEAAPWNVLFAALGAGFMIIYIGGQFVDCAKAEIYIWMLAAMASCVAMVRRETATAEVKQAKPGVARAKQLAGPRAAAGARGAPVRKSPAS